MQPSTLWERLTGWFGFLPVRLAYRIIWLTALLGGRTAKAVQETAWDAGLGVPCPPRRNPNVMWEPRFTAAEWARIQAKP